MDLSELQMDEAYINMTSNLDQESWLYALPDNCKQSCPYSLLTNLSPKESNILKLTTKHAWKFRVLSENVGEYVSASESSMALCDMKEYWNMGQFGVYNFYVQPTTTTAVACKTSTITEPVDIYLTLILCMVTILVAAVLLKILKVLFRKLKAKRLMRKTSNCGQTSLPIVVDNFEKTSTEKSRVASLDTFRGISILVMMFANEGSAGYYVLDHAVWDGLKLADIVFPWFVWIMGVCIPISINSQLKKNIPRIIILRGVVRRSCIIFGLGVMLSTLGVGARMETLRIFGILQRFGVLYLVSAGLCAALWPRTLKQLGNLRDILTILPQWIICLALHCVHILVVFLLPVPGCPTGYLGPGGISEDGLYKNCVGGATGYIDRLILTTPHIFQYPTSNAVYKSGPFDPEGPYGCLSSLLTVMLGVQAGTTLLCFPSWQGRVKRWSVWGVSCLIFTLPLALTKAIPINKNLWSTSFCMITAGLAFLVLTACYILVDVFRVWSGAPFIYPGMNATLMYVGHRVAYLLWPWHWKIGPMNTHLIVLIENLWGIAGWTLVAYLLYRRQFFLSI